MPNRKLARAPKINTPLLAFFRKRREKGGGHFFTRYLMALAFGLLSAFIFPPYFFLPLGIAGFTGLLWLVENTVKKRQAFFTGWWFGLGHFGPSLYWVHYSLLTDPERYAWLVPFSVLLIPSILGLYTGAVALAYSFLPGRLRVLKLLAFAALWVIAEMIRAWFPFGGFPWNLAGYAWAFSDGILQLASGIGIYGLSLVLVTCCASPALLLLPETFHASFFRRKEMWQVFCLAIIVAVIGLFGAIRMENAPENNDAGPMLRLVQANIPVRQTNDPASYFSTLRKHLEMSGEATAPRIVIWPESANSFPLDREPMLRRMIAEAAPEGGLLLIGSIRDEGEGKNWQIWNSIQGINHKGEIVATYDKATLVPFGEYVPLRRLFFFMDAMTMPGDFARGFGPRTIAVHDLPPFSPLICYEAIFPQRVVDKKNRPEWLLNVTNDAWFGDSNGPYQHFQMARTRAIEQGLPLARAANTGISAVFDAYGRVVKHTRLNEEAILDVPLPAPLPPTFYSRFGDWPLCAALLLFVAAPCCLRSANRAT